MPFMEMRIKAVVQIYCSRITYTDVLGVYLSYLVGFRLELSI
jgi:hypothetical protein